MSRCRSSTVLSKQRLIFYITLIDFEQTFSVVSSLGALRSSLFVYLQSGRAAAQTSTGTGSPDRGVTPEDDGTVKDAEDKRRNGQTSGKTQPRDYGIYLGSSASCMFVFCCAVICLAAMSTCIVNCSDFKCQLKT